MVSSGIAISELSKVATSGDAVSGEHAKNTDNMRGLECFIFFTLEMSRCLWRLVRPFLFLLNIFFNERNVLRRGTIKYIVSCHVAKSLGWLSCVTQKTNFFFML